MAFESPLRGLLQATQALRLVDVEFALVGGLAIAIRGEPRFTADIDLAVNVDSDASTEALVRRLRDSGFTLSAAVEHTSRARLSIARLTDARGTVVDLIAASSGIEREIVERAGPVAIAEVGEIPVARAEELLAMKVLSMTDKRPQDRIDALGLLLVNDDLDLEAVRENLREIARRGFHRDQDLLSKLEGVIDAARDA